MTHDKRWRRRNRSTGYSGFYRPRADRHFSSFMGKVQDDDDGEECQIKPKVIKLDDPTKQRKSVKLDLLDSNREQDNASSE